uniref:cDNA FLJ46097 fis, clone TESTI2021112 n=1 Tax=Homo sapiens TaxID=9606 RepID=Q6ZRU3_HUMAN|nr:unnamed protein product [Homo sapiens]
MVQSSRSSATEKRVTPIHHGQSTQSGSALDPARQMQPLNRVCASKLDDDRRNPVASEKTPNPRMKASGSIPRNSCRGCCGIFFKRTKQGKTKFNRVEQPGVVGHACNLSNLGGQGRISAIWEAKAGRSLEPRSSRPAWAT